MQRTMAYQARAASDDCAAVTALLIAVARRLNQEPRNEQPVEDSVTGLKTRIAVEAEAGRLFNATRDRNGKVSVVLVDVDGLKAINQSFGAAAGDAVLAHVAKLMSINIQPGLDLAGRLAGATMMLVLPEADYDWASSFAERLRGTLANRPLRCGDQMIEASACFGIASIVDADRDFDDLLARAEQALAAAKSGGPNLVCIAAGQNRTAA